MSPTCNVPPNKPIIDGPVSGKPNTDYLFSFNSTDSNNDAIMYVIDWGDGNSEWTEYMGSGVEIELKHAWDEYGKYKIKARAIDIHGNEGGWAEFPLYMSRDKTTNNVVLLRILERYNFLQKLLVRFGL